MVHTEIISCDTTLQGYPIWPLYINCSSENWLCHWIMCNSFKSEILLLSQSGTHESRAQRQWIARIPTFNPNCIKPVVGWIISIICIISSLLQLLDERLRDHLFAFFFPSFFTHSSSLHQSYTCNTPKAWRGPLSSLWLFWVMMIRANTEPVFLI